ncbi:class I SAM-dependent methyltransferase [uncultured Hoeflea sp.]|uniref:class I SAM-dependent methyltransferase n=1 Tax=uncultured Hoeflea sp. TaxID=538666 RepID=UPI0030DC5D90|tara:strand:- start:2607 stop:3245 length:639 start_codon:yes stop_codon:yes gene_type:complete
MLEKLNTPQAITVSRPKQTVVNLASELCAWQEHPVLAEIGVGFGATTLEVAKAFDNRGEIHLFDFVESANELKSDLANLGYCNIHAHGNTQKYWDSYHWSLAALLKQGVSERFDIMYIDGAHTYLHDALAFFMCDRLIKVGGVIVFDDWNWKFEQSAYMKRTRHEYMTPEQESSCQVGYVIDTLVKNHIGYEEIEENVVYKKIQSTTKQLNK